MSKPPESGDFTGRSPYKESFDIGYPQEHVEGEMHVYRCAYCKVLTTQINGRVENHGPSCEYRARRLAAKAAP